jgi:hypothetical protein
MYNYGAKSRLVQKYEASMRLLGIVKLGTVAVVSYLTLVLESLKRILIKLLNFYLYCNSKGWKSKAIAEAEGF